MRASPTMSITGAPFVVSNCSQPVMTTSGAKTFTFYTTVTAQAAFVCQTQAGSFINSFARL
jgi:hypothetical protein